MTRPSPSRLRALAAAFTAALSLTSLPSLPAHAADEPGTFPVERYRTSLDRDGLMDVEWGGVGRHLTGSVALSADYALNPLVLDIVKADGTRQRAASLVTHRVGAELVASISLFDWIELGAELPAVIFQSRDNALLNPLVTNPSTLNVGGLGDLRLVPKVRILRSQDQFVDLAIIPSFTVPTNIPSRSYIGEKGFTFAPELAISKAIGGLRMAGNLGWRLRDQTQFLDLDVNQELDYRAGIGYRFAQSFSLPLEIDLTANGATNILKPFQNFNSNPLEALGTVTYDINTAWSAYVGGGVGLFQGFGTPDLRLFAGVRWNPTDGDKDGDGIPDSLDKCPEEPEDKDGFEDSDGCPDPDNDKDGIPDVSDACPNEAGIPELQGCPERDTDGDGIKDSDDHCPGLPGPKENQGCPYADKDGDGILDADDKCPTVPGLKQFQGCPDSDGDGIPDAQDACPNNAGPPAFQGCPDRDHDGIPDNVDKCPDEPETINGFEDDDGCPDAGATKVKVTGSRVEILDKVYFDFNKATIQTRSFNLLDQVSSILRAHPEVTKIRVEGHTDAIGAADFNMTLSQARAESVRQYLIDHKVPAERLDAKGFGKTRPVATNATDAGREKNRRVEFVIVEMDGKPVENVDKLETHTPAH